jgi:hypothetical protein
VLRALRKNIGVTLLSAKKGYATVVLNTVEYIRKIGARNLAKDPTATDEQKLSKYGRALMVPLHVAFRGPLCPSLDPSHKSPVLLKKFQVTLTFRSLAFPGSKKKDPR